MNSSIGGPVAFGDERQGVVRYLDALREHWLLIVTIVAVAVGGAIAYSATAHKRYTASADILVTPVSASDDTFVGIPVLRDTAGQSSSVITAARLIKTPQVAEGVRRRLATSTSRNKLLSEVDVKPQSQSNIVTVTATAGSKSRAPEIANAFASELIAERDATFERELTAAMNRLTTRLRVAPVNSPESVALGQRVAVLRALQGSGDPTLNVTSRAVSPTSPSWPRPALAIAVALIAALLVSVGLAVALELLNPRLKREDDLIFGQRLPILARVPRMRSGVVRRYLSGRGPLPADVREAYRTLRASLAVAGPNDSFPRTILVTSAIPGEGKTMTSVNLAVTLALGGMRVVLVDGDLRRPMVATVFGVTARRQGFANLLLGEADPAQTLVPAPGHADRLQLLLASPEQAHLVDLLEPRRLENAMKQLSRHADVVIIDSPPLTAVADALNLASAVDTVLVAVRLGRSRRDKLSELRRMLAQRDVSPAGFVVTTRSRAGRHGYYYGPSDKLNVSTKERPERRRRDRGRRDRPRPRPPLVGVDSDADER